MDESEQVPADPGCLWGHHTLRCYGGDGGINGIATIG
jgi:hypothetical protein